MSQCSFVHEARMRATLPDYLGTHLKVTSDSQSWLEPAGAHIEGESNPGKALNQNIVRSYEIMFVPYIFFFLTTEKYQNGEACWLLPLF